MLKVVDYSKPLENWADSQGENLFAWAEKAWHGLVREILDILESDDVSNQKYAQIVRLLANLLAEGRQGFRSLEQVSGVNLRTLNAWAKEKTLPMMSRREGKIRQLLEAVIFTMRAKSAEDYVFSILRLIGIKDGRTASRTIITPSSARRSVFRIGLTRRLAKLLYQHGLKTVADLDNFVRPPRHPNQNPFELSPHRLLKLPGVHEKEAEEIIESVRRWNQKHTTPSTILV